MPDEDMKKLLTDSVQGWLEIDASRSILRCEVTRISALQIQFKVWPDNGGPRYFNVRVSEMM